MDNKINNGISERDDYETDDCVHDGVLGLLGLAGVTGGGHVLNAPIDDEYDGYYADDEDDTVDYVDGNTAEVVGITVATGSGSDFLWNTCVIARYIGSKCRQTQKSGAESERYCKAEYQCFKS